METDNLGGVIRDSDYSFSVIGESATASAKSTFITLKITFREPFAQSLYKNNADLAVNVPSNSDKLCKEGSQTAIVLDSLVRAQIRFNNAHVNLVEAGRYHDEDDKDRCKRRMYIEFYVANAADADSINKYQKYGQPFSLHIGVLKRTNGVIDEHSYSHERSYTLYRMLYRLGGGVFRDSEE